MNTSDTPRSPAALNQQFGQHRQTFNATSLLQLFTDEPARVAQFTLEGGGLLLDFSKNFCTQKTLQLFEQLAEQRNLRGAIEALFNGAPVNVTECRPALHTALRATSANAPKHDEIQPVLQRMERLVESLTQRRTVGFDGRPITDVIHIGIGGSDLGPLR
jgi:glucose-6-phosphate isomerase